MSETIFKLSLCRCFLKETIKDHSLKFREEVTGQYCISTASGEGR